MVRRENQQSAYSPCENDHDDGTDKSTVSGQYSFDLQFSFRNMRIRDQNQNLHIDPLILSIADSPSLFLVTLFCSIIVIIALSKP